MGGATHHALPGDHASGGPRVLRVSNFQWWSRVYGASYAAGAGPREAREPSEELLTRFFAAIRDNNVIQVAHILKVYPHLGFTKCFGSKQRTALYVASFFARVEIVGLLLKRGADRTLCCDGVLPSAVVGYGRHSIVDEMKVRCQLTDPDRIHVVLVAQERARVSPSRRLHIHFSEPVEDFIEEDLVVTNCSIIKCSQLSGDLFVVDVRVDGRKETASVQVPAGVASRRGQRDVANIASNVLVLELD